MNTASSSGSGPLPSNTIANPKGELKSITTRSGIVLDGPSIPMPPPFINPEEEERVEETLTDPELVEYTIKVPPPLVQKPQAPLQKSYEMPKRNPSPSKSLILKDEQEKTQDKNAKIQIHKFWQSLLSNKEKLLELANTSLNENCSVVILKKLPKKLGDPGKFLIPCSFSKLNCKALADLCASINLMPLSVWKKLGHVIMKSDPRVPLILGKPFLRTARALIDVHGEELILHDGDERLILNMKHGTSSYSNRHQRESTP
ncbi:hypothetical protein Tco_0603982 [Tanacetum coccineum]